MRVLCCLFKSTLLLFVGVFASQHSNQHQWLISTTSRVSCFAAVTRPRETTLATPEAGNEAKRGERNRLIKLGRYKFERQNTL